MIGGVAGLTLETFANEDQGEIGQVNNRAISGSVKLTEAIIHLTLKDPPGRTGDFESAYI